MSGEPVRERCHPGGIVLAVVLSLAFLAFQAVAQWARWHLRSTSPPVLTAVAFGSLTVYAAIAVGLVFSVARLRVHAAGQAALAICFGVALCVARMVRPGPGAALVLVALGGDLALVLAAAFLGVFVGRLIRERNMLIPVALVASLVDIWGVYFGVAREIGERAPETAVALSASVPMAAAPTLGSIGIGDFVFMGLFFAAVVRLDLRARATLWASIAALLAASAVFYAASLWAGLRPIAERLPGLPFLAAVLVAVNVRRFSLSREENRAIVVVVIALGAILAAVTLLWRGRA